MPVSPCKEKCTLSQRKGIYHGNGMLSNLLKNEQNMNLDKNEHDLYKSNTNCYQITERSEQILEHAL